MGEKGMIRLKLWVGESIMEFVGPIDIFLAPGSKQQTALILVYLTELLWSLALGPPGDRTGHTLVRPCVKNTSHLWN